MSSVIINSHVFGNLQDQLVQLSGALDHVSLLVCKVDEDFPDAVKKQISEVLAERTGGISSICSCLSTMAIGMSEDAEGWRYWAHKTDAQIHFKD